MSLTTTPTTPMDGRAATSGAATGVAARAVGATKRYGSGEAAVVALNRVDVALAAGLEALGLSFVVPAGERLPQLNAVWVPEGVDEPAARGRLLEEFGVEIGAGLGDFAGRVWRIGLMGHGAREENARTCLRAIEAVLGRSGGVDAADELLGVVEAG